MKVKTAKLLIDLMNMKPFHAALYAKKNTEFYNELYKGINYNNFNQIPIFSKYDYNDISPYAFLNSDLSHKVIHYGETSGSSGNPTPVFLTEKDFKNMVIMIASLCPYYKMLRDLENNVAVNLLTYGYTIAGFSLGMLLQHAKKIVAQLGARSTIAMPERNANVVSRLNPGIIAATPLDFMAVMNIIREDFPQKYIDVTRNLKYLLSTAEPCAVSRQKQIERYFGIVHINLYASVDGFIAIPCPCGEKHIVDAVHYVELLDKDRNLIGQHGQGRLVFTTLIKRASPMVRFLIDDFVTINPSTCPYGFRKSISPHGRFELTVEFDNKTYGNLDFEEIIFSHGFVMDYRVTVNENYIEVILEEYPHTSKYQINNLKHEYEDTFKTDCKVKIVNFGSLSDYREVRGKKSIIKILDRRQKSTQSIPTIL